jgi:hypothetical protein
MYQVRNHGVLNLKNISPQENEEQVGTGWHVMQLSGKQIQCTIVAWLLGNYIICRNVEIFKYIYFIKEKKLVKEK